MAAAQRPRRRREAGSALARVKPPLIRHAPEGVQPAIAEAQSRADDEVLDRARGEHLAGVGRRYHAGADMDGDSCHVGADQFAFTGVQASTDLEAKRVY